MNAEDFREYQREIGVGEVVIEEAVELFEEANRNNYTTGYAEGVVKAAVMYLAASKHNEPRTIRESTSLKSLMNPNLLLGKRCSTSERNSGLKLAGNESIPGDYVPRIC